MNDNDKTKLMVDVFDTIGDALFRHGDLIKGIRESFDLQLKLNNMLIERIKFLETEWHNMEFRIAQLENDND